MEGLQLNVQWIPIVIFIMMIIILIGFRIVSKQSNLLWRDAYYFIMLAEKTIVGAGKGQEKLEFVIKELYERLPDYMKYIMSPESIKNIVQEAFDNIKKFLHDKSIEAEKEYGITNSIIPDPKELQKVIEKHTKKK